MIISNNALISIIDYIKTKTYERRKYNIKHIYIILGVGMTVLQVRVDEELKNQAGAVYNELGMDLSTAIRMFLKRSVLVGGIPFDTKINESTLKAILAVDHMRTVSEKNGNSEMTLDEINEEIHKARLERKNKK